jgi:CheY-like chemotaxis protein
MQIQSVPPLLERLGYHVVGEIDARKALAIFRKQPGKFDLVITDQMMPFLTGDKLARALLRLRPDLPIILCTGFSETLDEEKAKALGIAALLMKPFSIPEIAAVIRRVLAAKT